MVYNFVQQVEMYKTQALSRLRKVCSEKTVFPEYTVRHILSGLLAQGGGNVPL